MKKEYKKPTIIFEKFEINENIAACETKVQFGPDKENAACEDYGLGGDAQPFSLTNDVTPFYKNGCQCYYAAPEGSGYFGNS